VHPYPQVAKYITSREQANQTIQYWSKKFLYFTVLHCTTTVISTVGTNLPCKWSCNVTPHFYCTSNATYGILGM